MNLDDELAQFRAQQLTRRALLGRATQGLGALALASLESGARAQNPGGAWRGAAGKAKRVIWLTMAGGPSHLETFDPKPKLAQMHGQPMPECVHQGPAARPAPGAEADLLRAAAPVREVRQEPDRDLRALPADRVGDRRHLLHSLDDHRRDQPRPGAHVHEHRLARSPAGRAWARGSPTASAARQRPAGLRRADVARAQGGQNQPIAARQWSSGFLPSKFQGVQLRSKGDPVLYLDEPRRRHRASSRARTSTAINALNREHNALVDDPEIATRIAQYEMAFQMQASVPELMDISQRDERDAGALRLPARRRLVCVATACSRGGSPSAACASSSSTTGTGTITAASRTA